MPNDLDLLNPTTFRENYTSQLRETIHAYSVPMIVVGEALQNALDAIEHGQPQPDPGEIAVHFDLDSDSVTVQDNGPGFPNEPRLLFLGGGQKSQGKQRGKVGVGIKVTLFSSASFLIQSRPESEDPWRCEITDAHNFNQLPHLLVPEQFSTDTAPLPSRGTRITYTFPTAGATTDRLLTRFVHDIVETCFQRGPDHGFAKHVQESSHGFPSRMACVVASYLRRYSYLADVLNTLQDMKKSTFPQGGLNVNVTLTCSDPASRFPAPIASLFAGPGVVTFGVRPSYLLADESATWATKAPAIFHDKLGRGGDNVERTDGLNVVTFKPTKDFDEFESLVRDKRGGLPEAIDEYRRLLFPRINGVILTLARIPDFDTFLPGGSRRIISANGVPTAHEIDFTRGRNQEYVRCFDLVIDLDASLNYGKTHLTDLHLLNRVRRFLNDAYSAVVQNAAGKWVGRLPDITDDDENHELFVSRKRLPLTDTVILNEPCTEHDVIALFFELAGRGVWPLYRFFGLSGKARYDGRAAIQRPCDPPTVLDATDDRNLRFVDFKLLATDVIRDFERKQKSTKELQLVIAWDEGTYTSQQYKVYDIVHSKLHEAKPKRTFPSVQKYIYDAREGAEVQVLLLRPIVETLAKPPGSAADSMAPGPAGSSPPDTKRPRKKK